MKDACLRNLHPIAPHLTGNYSVEDEPKTDGKRDIGSLKAEGERTGRRAAIYFKLVEEQKKRRYQNRDKRYVDGDQILRHTGDDDQNIEKDIFSSLNNLRYLLAGDRGDTGLADRNGEGPEQEIGERGLGVAAHAADKRPHRIGNAHAGAYSRNKSRDKKGKYNVKVK